MLGGEFEDMLRNASRPAPAAVLPEQVALTPEMQARLAAVCAENATGRSPAAVSM